MGKIYVDNFCRGHEHMLLRQWLVVTVDFKL